MRISLDSWGEVQQIKTNHAKTEITGSTITSFDDMLTEIMTGEASVSFGEDKLIQASELSVDELTELYLRLGITSPAGTRYNEIAGTNGADSTGNMVNTQSLVDVTTVYPNCSVEVPEKYVEYFKSAAATYNLPYELLVSVAKAESDFNTYSTSRSGAMGIMQLMPATAKYLEVTDAYEPQQNIMGGARYLKEKLNKHGSIELALAAYNAGSGAVEKYGGIPPYTETQNYVKKIKGFLGIA